MKSEKTQDAQIVFRDPHCRLADEAHPPRRDIGDAADIVVNPAVCRCRQCIDGEIAPPGVGPPIAAEHDLGLAAVGFDVLAQRRDFERFAVDDDGDGAVFDAGRDRFPAGRLDAVHDLLRHRRRRDVDLSDRVAQQCVTNRTADNARLLPVATEHGKEPCDLATTEPGRIGELCARRHRVAPGTNLPFSICAGT